MADFMSDLASKAGVGADQAHEGVGALLTMLKSRLDPETFSKLKDSIPNSDHILSSIEEKISGSGLLDSLKGMAAKFTGGTGSGQDALAALKAKFGEAGLSTDNLHGLLPKLHDMVESKLPPDVVKQIQEHFPAFGAHSE